MSLATVRIGLSSCSRRETSTITLGAWNLSSRTSIPSISVTTRKVSSCMSRRSPENVLVPSYNSYQRCRQGRSPVRNASNIATPEIRAGSRLSQRNTILDWNTFFKLRMSRRRYSLASSIVSSTLVTGAAFYGLSTFPEAADELTKLVPLDPVISMGLITLGATFLGWLIGPIFGNTLWKLLNRSRMPEFTVKERAFFERIKKHRVNPMGASTNNPVPDYYGEKIGSVSGYRRWLKDQRAFNRKREGVYPGGI